MEKKNGVEEPQAPRSTARESRVRRTSLAFSIITQLGKAKSWVESLFSLSTSFFKFPLLGLRKLACHAFGIDPTKNTISKRKRIQSPV